MRLHLFGTIAQILASYFKDPEKFVMFLSCSPLAGQVELLRTKIGLTFFEVIQIFLVFFWFCGDN
jgi:hypothetical protein